MEDIATEEPSKTSRLTKIGFWMSGTYTLLIGSITHNRWCSLLEMPLNELGDFFAGVFGPLAILWLVLGYLQQGRELRQNTSALKLQAESLEYQVEELKNSVEQQSLLATAASKEMEISRESLEYQRQKDSAIELPSFKLVSLVAGSLGVRSPRIVLLNYGATVFRVRVTVNISGEPITLKETEQLGESTPSPPLQLVFKFPQRMGSSTLSANIRITYTNRSGESGEVDYSVAAHEVTDDITGCKTTVLKFKVIG